MNTTIHFWHIRRLKKTLYLMLLLWASAGSSAVDNLDAEPLVWVVHPEKQTMVERVSAIASLSAFQEVKLSAGSSGRIERILIPAGRYVPKNQVLLRLQPQLELKAPFAGVVSDWRVKVGEYVNQGAELGFLIDSERLIVHYQLPESYATRIKLGQTLEIHARHLKHSLQAVTNYVSPEVDPNRMTLKVRAEFDNREHQLLPGSAVHVSHILGAKEGVLTVPESCVRMTLDGYSVLKVVQGHIVEVKVKQGARIKGRWAILQGLQLEDAIVLNHNLSTKPGRKVKTKLWTDES